MDPELLKQLAAAGMTDEQLRMLAPQMQLGQEWMQPQMAQGRQVGGTYKAASPFEHLSNALRQIAGGWMTGQAMDKQQDLLAQQRQARSAALQGLQTAQAGGQGGTLGMGGGGMARPPDPQAAQQLMGAMAGSGDSALQAGAHFGLQQENLARQRDVLANTQRYQQGMLGLKATEQGSATDAFGNPILYQKHALPGAVGAAQGQGRPAGGMGMTPEALDQAAEMFSRTGQLPQLRGKAASGLAVRIQNRAAELHPEANLAGNKAGFGADTASLRKIQTQADAVDAFEQTALKNLDQFLTTARTVVDTGSPLFNAPARRFMQSVAGDPKMAEFNTARQVAVQEISKVLGGSLGGVVSDSARHEASGLLGADASLAQIERAATILKQDMANRRTAMQEQIGTIRGRAGGQTGAQHAQAPAPASPPATAPTVRVKYKGQLLDIPAARLPEAIKDGAEQVK